MLRKPRTRISSYVSSSLVLTVAEAAARKGRSRRTDIDPACYWILQCYDDALDLPVLDSS